VLQAGRGIAAIAVVFVHVLLLTNTFVHHVPEPLASIMARGYLGVAFFFVLSGFLMYLKYGERTGDGHGLLSFVRARVIRIFVPYLPLSIAVMLAFTALPNVSLVPRDWSWVASIFLLPTSQPPALSVAWTLQHELVFYALFGVLVFLNRLWVGVAVWAVLILAAQLLVDAESLPWRYYVAAVNLGFIFGIAACWVYKHYQQRWTPSLIAAALLCAAAWAVLGAPIHADILVTISLASLMVVLSDAERRGALHTPDWLVYLGEASYSIYLIHFPVLSLTARLSGIVSDSWALSILLGVAASLTAGCVYHSLFERPALSFIAKQLRRRPATS
jgi:peptidoglycan/LPS O-acetylase OafA/YrhL